MTLNLFLQLCTCISTLALGIFVLTRQPKQEAARYFSLFAIGTALWNFCLFMAISTLGQATFWGRLAISFGSFMPAGLMLFLIVFPWRDIYYKTERAIVIVLAIFFFILPCTGLVVKQAWIVRHSFIMGQLGNGYGVFWAYYLGFLIIAYVKSVLKYRRVTKKHHKEQLWYVTFGFIIFFLPLLITQFILPLDGVFKYNNLGPLFCLPMIAVMSYAIIRHKLMDIRVVAQRSLVYVLLLLITVNLYVFGLQFLGHFLNEISDATVIITAGSIMIIGIIFWMPLKRWLEKVTDPIFFKDPYDYADALQNLSRILRTSVIQTDIISASSMTLKKIFKTPHADFRFASDTKTAVPSEHAAISLPIVFEDRQIAVLELGHKRSGDSYTTRDMQLLQTFSFQAATALEKARLYEQVQEYNSRLEKLVEKRTGEIQKLQEEQKQMMIDISHNLQTPLAVIRGELELLEEAGVKPDKMEIVSTSLDRVSSFIRQLLRLAKLDSSSFIVERMPINLSEIVRAQADYFEVMAEEKNVAIHYDAPETALVLGNKRMLEELLTNLVVNAIKYRSPDRNGTVRISLTTESGMAKLEIEDNGMGIPQNEMQELFTRFYRTTRTRGVLPGSGLGLAIAKSIVDKHEGTISVESSVDECTLFTVRIPLIPG